MIRNVATGMIFVAAALAPALAFAQGGAGAAAPGCVTAAITDAGAPVIRAEGFGDILDRQPLDAHSRFYAASVSKQFTAVAIAMLAEAGALSIDDDVRRWLPELAVAPHAVTIAMLLHHTSGLPDWMGVAELSGDAVDTVSRDRVLALMALQHPAFAPGSAFRYSNGGYFLLAEIVARAARMPFAQFLARNVFQPLGMTDSAFVDGAVPGGVVHGYAATVTGFLLRDGYPRIAGSGGLITSAADLARFDDDVRHRHRIWTPFVARLLMTPGTLSDGKPAIDPYTGFAYAGGLEIGDADGVAVIAHEGVADGFRNYYARFPALQVSVIVLCNRSDAEPSARAMTVLAKLRSGVFAPPRPLEFRSPTLAATYRLTRADHRILLQIISAPGSAARQIRPDLFAEQADGTFRSANGDLLTLSPGGRSFTLGAGLAGSHRFEAVTP